MIRTLVSHVQMRHFLVVPFRAVRTLRQSAVQFTVDALKNQLFLLPAGGVSIRFAPFLQLLRFHRFILLLQRNDCRFVLVREGVLTVLVNRYRRIKAIEVVLLVPRCKPQRLLRVFSSLIRFIRAGFFSALGGRFLCFRRFCFLFRWWRRRRI